jgi:hypothetical protein
MYTHLDLDINSLNNLASLHPEYFTEKFEELLKEFENTVLNLFFVAE